ncbi:MAG: HAD-IIB family hydrolase [Alphaproteobacteria bacterium]|nr:HAD-IIB family hydrolase [Alphaproteobacteria bacterium]
MIKRDKIVVFTDLDGSFLDHDSYDYSPALHALERLKTLNIPVIATTSKTLAEIDALNLPFVGQARIAENGTVVFDGYDHNAVGMDYGEIRQFLDSVPDAMRRHIVGFGDMHVEDVIEHTGLSEQQAVLAKDRLGSEPFLWGGDQAGFRALESRAQDAGLMIVQGGRFYHLMSACGGKDKAIHMLITQWKDAEPDTNFITVALGDGPNDADMLASVDYGIKIPNASGHDFSISDARGKIIDAPKAGPEGWNLSMLALLERLSF